MKFALIFLSILSLGIIALAILTVIYFEQIRPILEPYGSIASTMGLLVSLVGFGFTLWTVMRTKEINKRSQEELREKVSESQAQTRQLLRNIRDKSMSDTCDQACNFAYEARKAIRSKAWHHVAEKCQDARQLTLRLLNFPNLGEQEGPRFRAIVEDLQTLILFIERNRLKADAPDGLPPDKLAPLNSLLDELEILRSRLLHEIMEIPDGHR